MTTPVRRPNVVSICLFGSLFLGLFIVFPHWGKAESVEEENQSLQERVQQLEERVAELEKLLTEKRQPVRAPHDSAFTPEELEIMLQSGISPEDYERQLEADRKFTPEQKKIMEQFGITPEAYERQLEGQRMKPKESTEAEEAERFFEHFSTPRQSFPSESDETWLTPEEVERVVDEVRGKVDEALRKRREALDNAIQESLPKSGSNRPSDDTPNKKVPFEFNGETYYHLLTDQNRARQ